MSETLQITRADWHPRPALEAVDRLGREANRRAGERLLARAERGVPVDTGELAESASLIETDDGVGVGYTAEHAPFVRARGVALGGRDPEWFDHALEEGQDDVRSTYEDTFRAGWPTG